MVTLPFQFGPSICESNILSLIVFFLFEPRSPGQYVIRGGCCVPELFHRSIREQRAENVLSAINFHAFCLHFDDNFLSGLA